jgi:hypothetical protein
MIVAFPSAPGMREYQHICERHGFMSFPIFLDNNWVAKGQADIGYLEKYLQRYGAGLIRFAVAPDNMPEEARRLKAEWHDINWIYPLHRRDEDISDFDWIGFPHDSASRNYELRTFLELTRDKKRWYLGYLDGRSPSALLDFDGLDSTLPSTKAGRFGSLWTGFSKNRSVGHLNISTYDLYEANVINFKIAMSELLFHSKKTRRISDY